MVYSIFLKNLAVTADSISGLKFILTDDSNTSVIVIQNSAHLQKYVDMF